MISSQARRMFISTLWILYLQVFIKNHPCKLSSFSNSSKIDYNRIADWEKSRKWVHLQFLTEPTIFHHHWTLFLHAKELCKGMHQKKEDIKVDGNPCPICIVLLCLYRYWDVQVRMFFLIRKRGCLHPWCQFTTHYLLLLDWFIWSCLRDWKSTSSLIDLIDCILIDLIDCQHLPWLGLWLIGSRSTYYIIKGCFLNKTRQTNVGPTLAWSLIHTILSWLTL